MFIQGTYIFVCLLAGLGWHSILWIIVARNAPLRLMLQLQQWALFSSSLLPALPPSALVIAQRPIKANHSAAHRTNSRDFLSSCHPLLHFAVISLTDLKPSPTSSLPPFPPHLYQGESAAERACEYHCGLLLLHIELLYVPVRFMHFFFKETILIYTHYCVFCCNFRSHYLHPGYFLFSKEGVLRIYWLAGDARVHWTYTAATAQNIHYPNL